jgi:thiol:disulfide interchange protein
MRSKLFILLLALLPSLVQAQVKIDAHAVRQKEGQYLLTLTMRMENGFHLYAENALENIGAPSVSFTNASVKPFGLTGNAKKLRDAIFENKAMAVYTEEFSLSAEIMIEGSVPAQMHGRFSGFAAKGNEFKAVEEKFSVALEGGTNLIAQTLKVGSIDVKHPLNEGPGSPAGDVHSVLTVFFLGLVGGLLALLTPCVFPMIPVTVSFFTTKALSKKQGIRNGSLYGLFILGIYLCASLPFHLIKGIRPELLNNIATSAPLNIFFFIVFLFFAISFFGAFNISLPSGVATKAGKRSGIFFMALTLCIVSFSCTGPILGSLLVGSLSGGAWLLTAGLAGFGLALALPFGLFAIFPQALKKLPRSGAWMETVKKVLAFVELALAFKFLSNADLVMHWGILKREVFIGIWILIAVGLTWYLLRKEKMVPAVISFGCLCYLCTGLMGNPLTLLSGFPPPASYSLWENKGRRLEADVVNDYEKALARAKAENKKVLIDFTGWACVNCRKMEEHVWTNAAVSEYINRNFVLVSLYVDDKKRLPVEHRNDSLQTIGDKYAKFQTLNFGQASQPLYAVVNTEQQLMTAPKAYEPDAAKFLEWLKKSAQ